MQEREYGLSSLRDSLNIVRWPSDESLGSDILTPPHKIKGLWKIPEPIASSPGVKTNGLQE